MSTTDTTEKGLESLIMQHMTGTSGLFSGADGFVEEEPPLKEGSGWFAGRSGGYDREYAVDVEQLFAFLKDSQPDEYAKLGIGDYKDKKNMARQKFLARVQGEVTRRGVVDMLRHGIKHGPVSFDLFYGTPSLNPLKPGRTDAPIKTLEKANSYQSVGLIPFWTTLPS